MSNLIEFPSGKELLDTQKRLVRERRKEAVQALPQYMGEVSSKNQLRRMSGLAVGQIYWVSLDEEAWVVAEMNETESTLRKLDENASISTGLSIYDMNKTMVAQEPLFDFSDKDAINKLTDDVLNWFKTTGAEYFLMYGRTLHYFTLFKREDDGGCAFERDGECAEAFLVLIEMIETVGDLISIDFNTIESEKCLEIWIRTDKSLAEQLYLFPYDLGVVRFK